MDLELTSDQELFRATTQQFLRAETSLTTVRAWAETSSGFDVDWWKRGAELGWTSLLVSEADGGGSISGHPLCDLSLVAEEMGAMVSPGPIIPVNIVSQTLSIDGSAEMKRSILPGLLAGETVAAWCVAEPGRPFTAEGVALTAEAEGDGFILNGVKSPVEAGAEADWLLITARSPDGLIQCLLPADTPGVEIVRLSGLDLNRRYAKIRFNDVRVPAAVVVGIAGEAENSFERQLQTGLVLQCAEIVGAAECVFEFTLAYAFDRYSFGRPLASYQALKHRFADMKMWIESAQAISVEAARAVDSQLERAGETARIAKAYVSERCPELIQDCVQLHGGIGVTWDHDIHLYLRRVVLHRQTYGDPIEQREQIAVLAAS